MRDGFFGFVKGLWSILCPVGSFQGNGEWLGTPSNSDFLLQLLVLGALIPSLEPLVGVVEEGPGALCFSCIVIVKAKSKY